MRRRQGVRANGWAESPVPAAAIPAVVADKVAMVRTKTGPAQVTRHDKRDVMCSKDDSDSVHSQKSLDALMPLNDLTSTRTWISCIRGFRHTQHNSKDSDRT